MTSTPFTEKCLETLAVAFTSLDSSLKAVLQRLAEVLYLLIVIAKASINWSKC